MTIKSHAVEQKLRDKPLLNPPLRIRAHPFFVHPYINRIIILPKSALLLVIDFG